MPVELTDDYGSLVKRLSAATQGAEDRADLAHSPVLYDLLEHLPNLIHAWKGVPNNGAIRDELLHLLRILRNMCASGAETTTELIDREVDVHAAGVLQKTGDAQLVKVAAQLLANIAASGAVQAAAVWRACWPGAFQCMAAGTCLGHVAGPLSMILYHCCSASEALVAELCSRKGQPILQPLLQLLSDPQEVGDTHLEMLVSLLCFKTGATRDPTGPGGRVPEVQSVLPSLRDWHAGMLRVLANALDDRAMMSRLHRLLAVSRSQPLRGELLASSVLDITDALTRQHVDLSRSRAATLQEALRFLRMLTSLDDGGASFAGGQDIVTGLVGSQGLVSKLLSMLAAMGPVRSRRPDKRALSGWPHCPTLQTSFYTAQQPFQGYRTLLVAVLANVVYSRKSAQDEMQALGGVELMLAHCQVDDESPFLREAALWGIRNLCEGNTSIQKQIDELQVIGTVDSPELQQAGVQVQLDPATGKLKLIDMHT